MDIYIYIYLHLLTFQMGMLYINCVCVLKACFKDINDNLENLRKLVMNNIPRWISQAEISILADETQSSEETASDD